MQRTIIDEESWCATAHPMPGLVSVPEGQVVVRAIWMQMNAEEEVLTQSTSEMECSICSRRGYGNEEEK